MSHRLATTAALAALAACSAPPEPVAPLTPGSAPQSLHELFASEFRTEVFAWPRTSAEVAALRVRSDVQVLLSDRRDPQKLLRDGVGAAWREHVQKGGCLLLVGFTTRLAHDLGIEPEPPDRIGTYRWGVSDATALGTYEFGFRATAAVATPLCEGLHAAAGRGDVFHFGGGEVVAVPTCQWERTTPKAGTVLGRLARVRDGVAADLDAIVVVQWQDGAGKVLAIGAQPEPWRQERVGHNARRLLANAVRELAAPRRAPRVALLVDHAAVAPEREMALPPLAQRALPGAASVPLWGWQVALNDQRAARSPVADTLIVDQMLRPAWRAGAGWTEVRFADQELGYPFAWLPGDRLQRPLAWFGGEHWPEWSARRAQGLAKAAHAHGLLALLDWHPAPARAAGRAEALTVGRFLARELLDLRALGGSAFDGYALRESMPDRDGLLLEVVRAHQPAAIALATALSSEPWPGYADVVHCDYGRPQGLEGAGISAAWRDAFAPPQYLTGVLDARRGKPSAALWGAARAHGGGAYPDWLAIQAQDFARARLGMGAALLWHAHNPATLGTGTEEVVHGLSLDPLKAALAGRLLASGRNGFRDLQRASVERVQSGFGSECPLPHETPFLQNNHLRLYGSGGPLWFDPTGRAVFRREDPRTHELAAPLFTTRVRGARPSSDVLQQGALDFVHGNARGPGAYAATVVIEGDARGGAVFPAQLAREAVPRWPAKVEVGFQAGVGEYELELVLRGVEGSGIVELSREGEVVRLLAFRAGDGGVRHVLPFPLASGPARRFALEVVAGGAVAIDLCRLVRRADMGAETRVALAAGWRAELGERTASSFLCESKRLIAVADLPGFVLGIDYETVARGLLVQRVFGLVGYRRLRDTSAGEGKGQLTRPFVLQSEDPALPDLAVVPLQMPRYHHFALDAEDRLVLTGYPRAHEKVRVGFLFLRDHGLETLPHLARAFGDVEQPAQLELDASGRAEIHSELPFPWPRLLKLVNPTATPYLVREAGAWHWRGAQPDARGGEWLLVYQQPGAPVQIHGGPSLLTSTRPGPGSLHALVLREREDQAVTAEVTEIPHLLAAPSVTMALPFDEVLLNGVPWAYWRQQDVQLPRLPGRYAITTRNSGQKPPPHLVATRAAVRSCRWDPVDRVLEILTIAAGDGVDEVFTAVIAGPEPKSIAGGERVGEAELGYRDATAAAGALSQGIVVRFVPGLLRLAY